MTQDTALLPGSIEALEDHHPLSDRVYQRLRDAIIDGRLAAGQWLRQEALAQELGTSQLPVREAIRRLAAEGLAVRIPYKGVQVVEFSPEDIVDMFNVRVTLERLAVRYTTPLISAQELDELRKNLDKAVQYTEPDQMEKRRMLNTDFHLRICRASNHRYLIRQVEAMWVWFPSTMLYEGMRRQEALSQKRLRRENREHRAILLAMAHRDARLAEQRTQSHIRNLSKELAEVLGISRQLVDTWMS
ncbi:MAG: GntR family transcriptional regulator [Anaerolineales bacterium]|jgi:DNA-binding GntR family transcriptional regulator